jgi:RNA recognition motif-containing protein
VKKFQVQKNMSSVHETEGYLNTSPSDEMYYQQEESMMMPFDPNGPVKLFVGQVPRTMEEEELRPYLEKYGPLEDLVIIRDRLTGAHRGCAFATYSTKEAADQAVEELHNKVVLPQSINPLQVRPAEGQAGASQEHKLFIGMIPKTADENAIRTVFEVYGTIEEVYILRHPTNGQSKGCAFLKFKERESALNAIEQVNGIITMEKSTSPLVVKFADSRKQRIQRARNLAAVAYWQIPPGAAALPFPQLQQMQQQYIQQMQAFGAQAAGLNLNPAAVAAAAAVTAVGTPTPTSPTNSFMYYNPYAFGAPSTTMGASLYGGGYNTGAPSVGIDTTTANAIGAVGAVGTGAIGVTGATSAVGGGSTASSVLGSVEAAAKASRTAAQLEGPAGANLFIYHLPHDLTDADLATAFAPFGAVISAKVYMDKLTGESKGFGFVSYDTAEAADAAIASMNGFQIGSKRLKVQHKRIHHRPGDEEGMMMMEYNDALSPPGSESVGEGLEQAVHQLHI